MARQVTTIIRDDMTGAEIPQADALAVPLALGGDEWELDLSPESYAKLREMLEPITSRARRADVTPAPARRRPSRTGSPRPGREERDRIRAWWTANPAGLPPYRTRGRIPAAVVDAYRSATT